MSEIQAGWHAVSGASDLPAGSACAVTLLGEDIAIWRGESGSVQAWRNQCPHRGMRLSFGQVRGDRLSCRYHGWQFDGTGQCKFMPAHRSMMPPAAICVPSYGCQESQGLIWVSLAGDEFDDPAAASGMGNRALFCKSLYVEEPHEALAERLTAACFPPFSRASEPSRDDAFESDVLDHGRGPNESHAIVAWRCEDGEPSAAFSTSYQGLRQSPSMIRVAAKTGDEQPETLVVALQAMTDTRTGLHLVAESSGDVGADRRKRLHFGRWARRLRWFLGNPDAPFDGFRPWI